MLYMDCICETSSRPAKKSKTVLGTTNDAKFDTQKRRKSLEPSFIKGRQNVQTQRRKGTTLHISGKRLGPDQKTKYFLKKNREKWSQCEDDISTLTVESQLRSLIL